MLQFQRSFSPMSLSLLQVLGSVYGEGESGEPGGSDSAGKGEKIFGQADVDRIVQDRLRTERAAAAADKAANKQQLERLEALSSQLRGTAEAKSQLETEIEELRTRALTAEELKSREVQITKTQAAAELAAEKKQVEYWQNQFKSTVLENQLHAALVGAGAEFGTLAVAKTFLAASARVVDSKTDTGIRHEVRVQMHSLTADGAPIVLDLSPTEAVTKMKETPTMKTLFQSEVKSGAGSSGSAGRSKVNPVDMSDAEYMAQRKAKSK